MQRWIRLAGEGFPLAAERPPSDGDPVLRRRICLATVAPSCGDVILVLLEADCLPVLYALHRLGAVRATQSDGEGIGSSHVLSLGQRGNLITRDPRSRLTIFFGEPFPRWFCRHAVWVSWAQASLWGLGRSFPLSRREGSRERTPCSWGASELSQGGGTILQSCREEAPKWGTGCVSRNPPG